MSFPAVTGNARLRQASKPPRSAVVLRMPAVLSWSAARALDSSLGHVQYVTIGLSRGRYGTSPAIRLSGMCIEPVMWL